MQKYIIFGVVLLTIALLMLFLSLKGTGKKSKNEAKVREGTEKLLPQRRYDQVNRCYVMQEGKYMDLLQIQSKDLVTSSADEVEYDCLKFCKMYQLYEKDLKLIVMNFPCDTKIQQEFLKRCLQRTANGIYKQYLQRQIQELEWLEKNNTTREFYIMIFAESLEELEENKRTLKTTLHTGKDGLIEEIPDEKKQQILYRMNNKCSQVA